MSDRAGGVRRSEVWLVVALVLAAVVVAVAAQSIASRGSGNESNQPLSEVAEGPLTISVTESGTVQPTVRSRETPASAASATAAAARSSPSRRDSVVR